MAKKPEADGTVRLRMIVDARPTNLALDDPPGVRLCTPEGLTRFEVGRPPNMNDDEFQKWLRDLEPSACLTDIADCFHRMRVSENLSEWFCLPPVRASVFQISSVGGSPVSPEDKVFPAFACLPMGFSWSLFFAQRAGETILSQVPGFHKDMIINDTSSPVILGGPPRYFLYVDNLGVIGCGLSRTRDACDLADAELERKGLKTHGVEAHSHSADTLGITLDLDSGRTHISQKRFWRISRGIDHSFRCGGVRVGPLKPLWGTAPLQG